MLSSKGLKGLSPAAFGAAVSGTPRVWGTVTHASHAPGTEGERGTADSSPSPCCDTPSSALERELYLTVR